MRGLLAALLVTSNVWASSTFVRPAETPLVSQKSIDDLQPALNAALLGHDFEKLNSLVDGHKNTSVRNENGDPVANKFFALMGDFGTKEAVLDLSDRPSVPGLVSASDFGQWANSGTRHDGLANIAWANYETRLGGKLLEVGLDIGMNVRDRRVWTYHLRQGEDILDDAPTIAQLYPEYWKIKLNIMRQQLKPLAERLALFDAAAQKFPDYTPIFYEGAMTVLPQFGGSIAAIQKFTDHARLEASPAEADIIYGLMWKRVAEFYEPPTTVSEHGQGWILMHGGANLEEIKDGYAELVRQFPSSRNLEDYVFMSAFVGDFTTANLVLDELSAQGVKALDGGEWSTDKDWATDMVRWVISSRPYFLKPALGSR